MFYVFKKRFYALTPTNHFTSSLLKLAYKCFNDVKLLLKIWQIFGPQINYFFFFFKLKYGMPLPSSRSSIKNIPFLSLKAINTHFFKINYHKLGYSNTQVYKNKFQLNIKTNNINFNSAHSACFVLSPRKVFTSTTVHRT